jgi:hypothetical protein
MADDALDKYVPDCTPIDSLVDGDLLYVARTSTGEDCAIDGTKINAVINSLAPVHVVCPYGQSTAVGLNFYNGGAMTGRRSVTLDCMWTRNNQARKQIVQVFFANGQPALVEGEAGTIPDDITDLGISLDVDSYYDVHLVITVDSVPVAVNFYYKIISSL